MEGIFEGFILEPSNVIHLDDHRGKFPERNNHTLPEGGYTDNIINFPTNLSSTELILSGDNSDNFEESVMYAIEKALFETLEDNRMGQVLDFKKES